MDFWKFWRIISLESMEVKSMSNVINSFKKAESKTEKISIAAIAKKIEKHTIRFDHPSQRCSDQWTNKMKGNLISDIIQGNPVPHIIFAEQNINGITITWDLDGKQRCTTVYNYIHNGFKISKQVRRNIIKYQSPLLDEKGNPMLDDQMIPMMEIKEFNIANKSFNQLPEELQDAIMEYCFDATIYLDCSSEDIVYHIARYNDGKPMNKTQKGIINLGEEYATEVKNIAKSSFFIDCGDFGAKGQINGNIDRCVCETIMACNYLDNWAGNNLEEMCNYIKENATIDEFETFENELDEIEDVIDETNEKLFTNKESFIWLTVFHRFKSLGIDADRFGEFLTEFVENNLADKKIGEFSYSELEGNKSTKDKNLVIKKINHLETLMKEYLDVKEDSAA